MEDVLPDGTEGADPIVVRDTARADLADAVRLYTEGVQTLRDLSAADLADAQADYGTAVDTLRGDAANVLEDAARPVYKYLDKVKAESSRQLTEAYRQLYAAGAQPLVYAEAVAEDINRGDLVASAVEQLLAPLLPAPDPSAPDGGCPPGYQFDSQGGLCKVGKPPIPESTPSPVSPVPTPRPTPTDYLPSPYLPEPPPAAEPLPACPAAEPVCPVLGPPQVILLPAPPAGVCPLPEPAEPPATEPPATEPPTAEPPAPPVTETAPPPRPVSPPPTPPKKFVSPFGPTMPAPADRPTDWSSPGACRRIEADLSGVTVGPVGIDVFAQTVGSIMGSFDGAFSLITSLIGLPSGVGGDATAAPAQSVIAQVGATQVIRKVSPSDAAYASTLESLAALTAIGWGERLSGAPVRYLGQGYVYDLQYANPQYLPSQSEINGAFLNYTVSREVWECVTKANGNHVWGQEAVVRAGRLKPGLGECIALWRRGQMSDAALQDYARQSGVLDPKELDAIVTAGEFVPPYSDIIRMMVRDSADQNAVDFGKFDDGFTDKFVGPLREWAKALGIDEKVFRYLWRAHWELPSPTQLYEMLRRLRPGKVDDALAVTAETVRKTLEQNDLAPGFVDRLMAVSYNTITRTDLMMWYVNGSITEQELVDRLQDTGYSEPDAKRIVEGWSLEKANRVSNRSLLWTRRNITKNYIAGNIDRATADKLLSRTIPLKGDRDDTLDDADAVRGAERRAKCIRAVKRRMVMGELGEIEARRELVRLNLDAAVAAQIAEGWTCEIASMAKEPTVKMLKEWLVNGIIDTNDFYQRLINLRYTREDAKRILDSAVVSENKRIAKLAEKAAKEAAARAERAARERDAAARRAAERAARAAEQAAQGQRS